MNSRKNDFSYLTGQAYAAFGESHAQVKERFKDFPMCLMDYIDNGGHEEHIEISFDEKNASVTYCFDTGRMLLYSVIYFCEPSDVGLFLCFLEGFADSYDYLKKRWIIDTHFYMTVQEKEPGIYFYCYKL